MTVKTVTAGDFEATTTWAGGGQHADTVMKSYVRRSSMSSAYFQKPLGSASPSGCG